MIHSFIMRSKSQRTFSNLVYFRSIMTSIVAPKDTTKPSLEIISKESIKPASPTPHHLRVFKLSMIDQFMVEIYTPMTIFLPNNDNASITRVLTERSRHLKDTLSEILTRFYPFAGEIVKDKLHVECNDKGVLFVEARVPQTLQEFLRKPDHEQVRELIPPEHHVASFQANFFDCGGIALSTSLSHKVVDGHSYFLFMNAWAAAVRGSPEKITPSYVASELFPNNPSLDFSMPATFSTRKQLVTKRFVFSSTALTSLKAAATSPPFRGPSRTEATGALVWKAASKAATTLRSFGEQSPHFLFLTVNLRNRAIPPLPTESVGNLATLTVGACFPYNEPDLPTLMGEMRRSIGLLNSDFIEARKGEEGHRAWAEGLKSMGGLIETVEKGDSFTVTSMLNNSVREMDFGWGKPVWFYYVHPGTDRMASLHDTMKVGGVEAIVSLPPDEMKIFESDPDLLSYATVDPSPLLYVS